MRSPSGLQAATSSGSEAVSVEGAGEWWLALCGVASFAAPAGDGDRHEQACRGDGHVNACGERMHALSRCRVSCCVREDRRGRDREDDRAADLERAADETGRETLLIVAHAG
jgi:hypothetical protein